MSAFEGCKSLQSIVVPEGVINISDCAFEGCSSLTEITLLNPEVKIGRDVFKGCVAITTVNLPKGLTWAKVKTKFKDSPWGQTKPNPNQSQKTEKEKAKREKLETFNQVALETMLSGWSHKLTSDKTATIVRVDFPNGHAILGRYLLKGKFDLQGFIELCRTEAAMTDEIPTLRITSWKNVMEDMSDFGIYDIGKFREITLPNGLTAIRANVFSSSSLENVVIPEGVTEIGDSAFEDCKSLKNVAIPDTVTQIGCDAFHGCTSLQSVTIPNSVTKIESSIFSGCSSLPSIIIPEGVTKIGKSAFYGCTSLQNLIIPDSVTEIGAEAFYGCNIGESEIETSNFSLKNGLLIAKAHDLLVCSFLTNLTSVTIPESVTEIGDSAFSNCKSLQSVIISGRATKIGKDAFGRCNSLQSITLPDSVTEIGERAFSGCASLQSIVIPESVTEIGDRAFEGCTSLQSIIIPESVTIIGWCAFGNCRSLQSITLPDSGLKIDNAFSGCTSLQRIVVAEANGSNDSDKSKTNFYLGRFNGFESLKSLTIPFGMNIGVEAFAGCTSLTEVTIKNPNIKIERKAFENCTAITKVNLPMGLTWGKVKEKFKDSPWGQTKPTK